MCQETLGMPCEPRTEESVLGCILLWETDVWIQLEALTPSDFYDLKNADLFKEFLKMRKSGIPIDSLSALERGILDQRDVAAYIDSVSEGDLYKIPLSVKRLKRASIRRNMVHIADRMKQRAYDPMWELSEVNIAKIADTFRDKCTPFECQSNSNNPFIGLKKYAEEIKRTGGFKFGTGLSNVDKYMQGGLIAGQSLSIVGAQGSMKTSLALNGILKFIDDYKRKVIYFCIDPSMSQDSIRTRLLQLHLSCSESDIIEMAQNDNPELYEANDELQAQLGKYLLVIEGEQTLETISALIERERPSAIVYDYMTAISGYRSDYELVNDAMSHLNKLAKKYKACNMFLHQMARTSKIDQRNGNFGNHAKGGGATEERVDVEIEIMPYVVDEGEEQYANCRQFVFTKNRKGSEDKLLVHVNPRWMGFVDIVEEIRYVGKRKSNWKVGTCNAQF